MADRPLVLVAIDQATDLERTLDVTRRVAKARGADVHVNEFLHARTFCV